MYLNQQTTMYKIAIRLYSSTQEIIAHTYSFWCFNVSSKKFSGKTKGTRESNLKEFQLALNEDLLSYGMLMISKYLKGTNMNFRNTNWTKRNRSIK